MGWAVVGWSLVGARGVAPHASPRAPAHPPTCPCDPPDSHGRCQNLDFIKDGVDFLAARWLLGPVAMLVVIELKLMFGCLCQFIKDPVVGGWCGWGGGVLGVAAICKRGGSAASSDNRPRLPCPPHPPTLTLTPLFLPSTLPLPSPPPSLPHPELLQAPQLGGQDCLPVDAGLPALHARVH